MLKIAFSLPSSPEQSDFNYDSSSAEAKRDFTLRFQLWIFSRACRWQEQRQGDIRIAASRRGFRVCSFTTFKKCENLIDFAGGRGWLCDWRLHPPFLSALLTSIMDRGGSCELQNFLKRGFKAQTRLLRWQKAPIICCSCLLSIRLFFDCHC